MSSRASRTIYVGNLPGDVREREIEDLFYKYGRIVDIDLKLPPRPPGYCFIEFEDARDAEDAIRGRDGYNFDGNRLRGSVHELLRSLDSHLERESSRKCRHKLIYFRRKSTTLGGVLWIGINSTYERMVVELAHGGRAPPLSLDRYNGYSSASGGVNRGLDVVGRTGGVSRRSEYRVIVTGLPASASWQDLKDHMRRAGDVCFAQVFRDGNGTMGIVDFTNYEDMKYAIRKLDDSEFRNPFSRSFIRVKEDKGYGLRRSESNSRSRSRSGSGAKSPHSRSNSRSLSHSRSRSRSRRHSLTLSKERSRTASLSLSRSQSPVLKRKLSNISRSRSPSPKETLLGGDSNGSASPNLHD